MKKDILSIELVGKFIEDSLRNYVANERHTKITDIHLQLQPETGELTLFNDDEMVLSEAIIEEWKGDDNVYAEAELLLRNVLNEMRESGNWDTLSLIKPYSFVLIDSAKETIAELLIVDDQDTLFLNDDLLKGLDEELNEFLKKLLER